MANSLFSGYWFLDNPDLNWSPPESLTSFLKNGRKPVYIGFGSIVVADPDQLIQTVLKAVQKAGIRVILSKGWSARSKKSDDDVNTEDLLKSMENIYVIDQVPHDWLFPQIAGVVHHGGAGTTAAGLRAGVPTIIKPFFGDQFFWAERVQDVSLREKEGVFFLKLLTHSLASFFTAWCRM